MQILRAVLITFWSILCLSSFYGLIKGGGPVITMIWILCVIATIFALNNKGGEAIRIVALVYCGIFIVSLGVVLVDDIDRYFDSALNPVRILFFVALLLVNLLTFAFLIKDKRRAVNLSDK